MTLNTRWIIQVGRRVGTPKLCALDPGYLSEKGNARVQDTAQLLFDNLSRRKVCTLVLDQHIFALDLVKMPWQATRTAA